LLGVPLLLALIVLVMSVFAPTELQATQQRVFSLSDYRKDPSYTYRKAESRMVKQRIRAHPLTGQGLGASQLIGRPGTRAPVRRRSYVESGYLWLAWKLGIPGAALLCGVLLAAALCRQAAPHTLAASLRIGSQAALVTLAVSNLAFAPFNSISGTTMIGVLIAVAIGPASTRVSGGARPA
jgi:O-antigen ligase